MNSYRKQYTALNHFVSKNYPSFVDINVEALKSAKQNIFILCSFKIFFPITQKKHKHRGFAFRNVPINV